VLQTQLLGEGFESELALVSEGVARLLGRFLPRNESVLDHLDLVVDLVQGVQAVVSLAEI
jgi:hypothetical protein